MDEWWFVVKVGICEGVGGMYAEGKMKSHWLGGGGVAWWQF